MPSFRKSKENQPISGLRNFDSTPVSIKRNSTLLPAKTPISFLRGSVRRTKETSSLSRNLDRSLKKFGTEVIRSKRPAFEAFDSPLVFTYNTVSRCSKVKLIFRNLKNFSSV